MVRPTQEEIDKLLKQNDLDTDGSESVSGTNPVPGEDDTADVDTMISEVIGNSPKDDEEFNIGDEVNHDEKSIRNKEIKDYSSEEDEDSDEFDDEAKNVADDVHNDPSDSDIYGEDDDADDVLE